MRFTDSKHCALRLHCAACRSSREFRQSLAETFDLPDNDVDFVCPHGQGTVIVAAPTPQKPARCGCSKRKTRRGLGDMVAAVTIAVGLNRCGGCKRRQVRLNRFGCCVNRWLHRVVEWLIPCGSVPKR